MAFALSHNKKYRNSKSRQIFDFNATGGKLGFSALHYAVYQNNFALLNKLLQSEEPIDHKIEDAEGRRAIDLCNSISAVFKTLRHELDKQNQQVLKENLKNLYKSNY